MVQKGFFDLDILKENSVELPKAAKSDDVIVDIKYYVKDIKFCVNNNILEITSKLSINILYKSVDHTIRWNEQTVPINISSIWDGRNCKDIECQCMNIKKMSEKIIAPNICIQQIYICFRIYFIEENILREGKKIERTNKRHMEEMLKAKEEVSSAKENNLSLLLDQIIENLKT